MISAIVALVRNIKTVMAQFSKTPPIIMVAVAIICNNDESKILITQRGYLSPHPGKWEFPGGKVRANEKPEIALSREIKEELGINIIRSEPFTSLNYSYIQNKSTTLQKLSAANENFTNVNLMVYKITAYTGNAKCLENQLSLEWVHAEDLNKYDFLEANYQLIDLIKSDLKN